MSVEDRLARLERENRRLKVAGLLVLAIIGSVFVMGQARPSPRLSGESLTLYRPGTTNPYVMMFTSDDGVPQVSVHDEIGEGRIDLRIFRDSPSITVRGSTSRGTGAARATMVFNSAEDGGDGLTNFQLNGARQTIDWSVR